MNLTPFRDAAKLAIQLARERTPRVEECLLSSAQGRVLAEDVVASEMLPGFRSAALDGFALSSTGAGLLSPSGTQLLVMGRILAGQTDFRDCSNREPHAHRIMTGAPVPRCSCAVVGKEDVSEDGGSIVLQRDVPSGFAVRPIGSDVQHGTRLARCGDRITAGHFLAFASLGVSSVKVAARPRVAFAATGAELHPADTRTLPFGSIRDSSTPFLLAALRARGIVPIDTKTLPDERPAIDQWLEDCKDVDVVLTTGGVSVGDADHLRASLESTGATIHLHGVAMRPGKPLLIATVPPAQGGAVVFALPGNPYASAAAAAFFVNPCLDALQGARSQSLCAATLRGHVRTPANLTCLWRARASVSGDGRLEATVHPARESYRVSAFLETNAWAMLEGCEAGISDGTNISVLLDDSIDGPDR